jgi:class 3 adenylate cyclase/tetratricopeptide (TPR) repeat protein
VKSFTDWLAEIGLERYASKFQENDIDFAVVRDLSEADLKELGLTLGHRKRFQHALARLGDPASLNSDANPAFAAAAVASSAPQEESTNGERRQLTVMFCDLVGSTALSEKLDPEELRALLHDYRSRCGEVIGRYEGFVARYVGDGILTYFGWPKAHEEDAERSVRAALEIVQAVKRVSCTEPLSVRIGIATGPVVVGEQAGEGDQAKLAVGSTPNLAARLQGLAAADQIIIASSTHRLVGNAFDFSDLGEHELKGISETVHAWQVVGVSESASRFEAAHGKAGLTPLVGREQEIGLLLDRWQQAQEGEGQVVLLSGEAGIGKSRVLNTLRERLEDQGVGALRLQCSPYYVNSAYYPTIDNFERALKFRRDESPESKLDKLEALMVGHYGLPLTDVRFVAAMLSIACEARYGAISITPQKHKDETLRVLVAIVEAAARQQPTAMLYEDLHWADPTSLEALDLLIDRVRSIPLLIVLTHRPEFQPKWGSHGHVTALNLSKLTRAQSGAIVSKLASGKALPANLLEQILAKADGVPLYVEELTKAILESGELKDAGDHYDYAGAARSVTIPATLRDSLMARLDRFMPVKEIAQIGAAIGREFSYELIEAVAPRTKSELDSALQQLTDSGLAFRRGMPPDAVYTFKHALVQDAAYDSLLKSRRQVLHAKIARVLEEHFPATRDTEPELLAHHLTAAGQAEAAIDYWQKAGKLALKRLAVNEAISHLNHGMELIGTLPQSPERDEKELDLRTVLGTAWLALKGWSAPEVWSSFHPALGLAKSLGRHEAIAPIYHGLWVSVQNQGRAAEALDRVVNEMLATAEASGDLDLLIVGHRAACVTYFSLGHFNQSREHGDRALARYSDEKHRHLADRMNTDPKTSVGAFVSLGAWMLGYPERAVQVSDANDAHARRRGHPFDLGWALTVGSGLWDHRREPEAVLARVEEAERLGRAHNLPLISEAMAQVFKGLAWLRAGRLAEGIPQLRGAMERWNPHGGGFWMPYFRATLAEGLALSGDLDGGLSLIEESLAQIARPGWEERSHLAEVLRLKGWMLQQQGKLAAAEENYLASCEVACEQQAKSWELRTSTSLARLLQSQGKRKEALDLLKPVYDWFTEGFDTKDLKEAKALLAELSA